MCERKAKGIGLSVSLASITVAAIAVGAWSVATAQNASDMFDGQWRYQTSCATCHGEDGTGIYAFGPALKGDAFVTNTPAPVIINVIQNGRYNRDRTYPDYPGMPAFDYIRAGEAEALVAYLKGGLQQ
jgi:mono/diheme cytochrome c family protein